MFQKWMWWFWDLLASASCLLFMPSTTYNIQIALSVSLLNSCSIQWAWRPLRATFCKKRGQRSRNIKLSVFLFTLLSSFTYKVQGLFKRTTWRDGRWICRCWKRAFLNRKQGWDSRFSSFLLFPGWLKRGGKENGMVTGLGDLYLFIIGHEDCCLSLCSNCELKSSHGRQEWKC